MVKTAGRGEGLAGRAAGAELNLSKIFRKNCPMSFLNRSLKALRYLTTSGLSVQVNESMTQIFSTFYSKNVDFMVARTLFRSF